MNRSGFTFKADCPVPGCDRSVPRSKLMCGPCWGAVPPETQRRVYRTWQRWQRTRSDDAFEEYNDARTEAIEAV